MKVQDIIEMNKHDKQSIYEAYSLETQIRKDLNQQLNNERRETAKYRFAAQYWQDEWLREKVMTDVSVTGDKEQVLEEYFAHPKRLIAFTDDNGFYAFTDEGDHIFIWFAWGNQKAWGREIKNMTMLIKEIARMGLPIRWTGVHNVLQRHSIEISPGLWQLDL